MFAWIKTRRWKQSVEAAISPVHAETERSRLGADLWSRTMALWGTVPSELAPGEDSVAGKVAGILERHIDSGVVEASLGLRYLHVLNDRLRWADYEDVPSLQGEVRWVEDYLARRLRSPWIRAALKASPEGKLPSPDELYDAMAMKIVAESKAASLAA